VPVEPVAALSATLPPLPGRPVPPGNLHLTVRFLGRVEEPTRDRLTAALDEIDLGGGFELRLGAMGAFPRSSRASVLWLALTRGSGELTRLHVVVEEACEGAGFEPEDRPYSPHLTISRMRPVVDVRGLVAGYEAAPIGWSAKELVLFESHLGRGGAVYEPLERFEL
jgi:2'-5' RNA ligase